LQNNPRRLAHVSVGAKARQVRDGGLFVLLIIVFLNSKEVTANRKKRAKQNSLGAYTHAGGV